MASKVLVRNICSRSKVEPCFEPLIEGAIRTYQDAFVDSLVAVYLMGSVPRGEAIAGVSDIDFLGVVCRETEPADLEYLSARESALAQTFPVVAGVDLEAERLDTLAEFRKFVLASDSICISGTDSFTRRQQYVERRFLADLVTPDAPVLIRSYRAAVERLDSVADEGSLARYARLTGKDLLKYLRRLALERGARYERNIGAIHRQLVTFAPEHGLIADELYGLYCEPPRAEKARILRVLDQAAETISIG
ncbi:MAG: hypothetical protein M3069_05295 [Chloroflexota bacterium]|nr:hypothetical protein [Chloroflexota bacterium]